jgi:polysaccharide biosynthesis/export protein
MVLFVSAMVLLTNACAPSAPSLAGAKIGPSGEYIIGPGDQLNVFVYGAPSLGATVPVRPDGRISTPLVPDVVAAGRTTTELARAIEKRLSKYVKQPNVTIMITGIVGFPKGQVRVIGQVAQPLVIPYHQGLSVLDVMIAAKGLTHFAAGNRAVIVRQEQGGPKTFGVRLDDLLNDGDISQNVALRPGDTLFVPEAWF